MREDFREILRLVRPDARVLDVGCGEGGLLELLTREKNVDGQGLEISPEGVAACVTPPRCSNPARKARAAACDGSSASASTANRRAASRDPVRAASSARW